MSNFFSKLTSRKFLSCIAGIVIGICVVFGADENSVETVAGAVTSLISIAVYIYTEGKIDKEAVNQIHDAIDKIEGAVDAVGGLEEAE